MSGLGKFLFGAAVTGAAAYGVYSFLQKYRVEIKPIDEEEGNTVDGSADFVESEAEKDAEDPVSSGETESEGHSEKTFDPGKIFDPEKAAAAAGTIRNAANRAYTTIQHGSQQAADVVRDTVIPKGTEVVGKVKDTVLPKGQEVIDKVKEAIQGKAEETPAADAGETDPADAAPDAKEEASAADPAESAETFVSEEKPEEKTTENASKKDETIEFFDDEG